MWTDLQWQKKINGRIREKLGKDYKGAHETFGVINTFIILILKLYTVNVCSLLALVHM